MTPININTYFFSLVLHPCHYTAPACGINYDLHSVAHNLVMNTRLTSLLYDEITTRALLVRSHLFSEFEFYPQWYFFPFALDWDFISVSLRDKYVCCHGNLDEWDDINTRIWYCSPKWGRPFRQFVGTIEKNRLMQITSKIKTLDEREQIHSFSQISMPCQCVLSFVFYDTLFKVNAATQFFCEKQRHRFMSWIPPPRSSMRILFWCVTHLWHLLIRF